MRGWVGENALCLGTENIDSEGDELTSAQEYGSVKPHPHTRGSTGVNQVPWFKRHE